MRLALSKLSLWAALAACQLAALTAQAADTAKPAPGKASQALTQAGRVTQKVGDTIDRGVDKGIDAVNRGAEVASSAVRRTVKRAGLPASGADAGSARPAKQADRLMKPIRRPETQPPVKAASQP